MHQTIIEELILRNKMERLKRKKTPRRVMINLTIRKMRKTVKIKRRAKMPKTIKKKLKKIRKKRIKILRTIKKILRKIPRNRRRTQQLKSHKKKPMSKQKQNQLKMI
jgi:hypothetical protein